MDPLKQWHRLFGMTWTDFFTDQPVTVELEVDTSRQKQLLDILLIRLTPNVPLTIQLPDGLEDLAAYNLISYKSHRETLDGWTLNELISHYVNYRKFISPNTDELIAEDQFRLYAISARSPQFLRRLPLVVPVQPGVYTVAHFSGALRILVLNELPRVQHNAVLHLFSANEELVRFGTGGYQPRSPRTSTFLIELYNRYQQEGLPMPITAEEFEREIFTRLLFDANWMRKMLAQDDNLNRLLAVLPVQECLEAIPVEQRLEGVPVEQILEGVPVEQLLENVPVEQRLEGVPVEQRLLGLSAEDRARLLRQLLAETNLPAN